MGSETTVALRRGMYASDVQKRHQGEDRRVCVATCERKKQTNLVSLIRGFGYIDYPRSWWWPAIHRVTLRIGHSRVSTWVREGQEGFRRARPPHPMNTCNKHMVCVNVFFRRGTAMPQKKTSTWFVSLRLKCRAEHIAGVQVESQIPWWMKVSARCLKTCASRTLHVPRHLEHIVALKFSRHPCN